MSSTQKLASWCAGTSRVWSATALDGARRAFQDTMAAMLSGGYSNRFATALDGVDIDHPGSALDRSGHPNPVPRIVGKIKRKHAFKNHILTKKDKKRKRSLTKKGLVHKSDHAAILDLIK